MADIRELTCISCPVGCQMTITITDGDKISVEGNRCPKGIEYAKGEVFDPRRILTTTISVRGGKLSQLPVRTREAIKKGSLKEAMDTVAKLEVEAPVKMGDVIVENFISSGTDLIASRSIDRKI